MLKVLENWIYSYHSHLGIISGARKISQIVKRHIADDAFVANQLSQTEKGASDLKRAVGETTNYEKVRVMAAKDETRDSSFRNLLGVVDSFAGLIHLPEKQKAAELLQLVLTKHGRDIYEKSHDAQSGAFDAILDAFETEESQGAIQELGIESLVSSLKQAQAAFIQAEQDKVIAEASTTSYASIRKEARDQIAYRLNVLLSYLDVTIIDSEGELDLLGKELNEAIEEMNVKARSRRDAGRAMTPDVPEEDEAETETMVSA